jgi:hypothetical protein
VGGCAAAATAMLNTFVPVLFAASVTCTVNDTVPAVVGVPEISPVDAARLNPAGNVPALTLQLYGVVPPLACSVPEYAVPTVPPVSDVVVTVGGCAAAATAILNTFVPVLFTASVTCTVNDTVPAAVGVPEISPVDAARLNPAGNVPALTLQLYGVVPPLACSVVEYAMPAVPPFSDVVVTDGDCAVAATSIVRFAVAIAVGEPESFTCTVKAEVPACVGVPEIKPEPEIVIPTGKLPFVIDQLYGAVPPVAAKVVEYAIWEVPLGRANEITTKACFCSGELPAPTTPAQPEDQKVATMSRSTNKTTSSPFVLSRVSETLRETFIVPLCRTQERLAGTRTFRLLVKGSNLGRC